MKGFPVHVVELVGMFWEWWWLSPMKGCPVDIVELFIAVELTEEDLGQFPADAGLGWVVLTSAATGSQLHGVEV